MPFKVRCFSLALLLLLSLASSGAQSGWIESSQALSDTEASAMVGGLSWGGCGILVGIAVGVVALGSSTVTVGMGAAVAISLGAHVAAALCVG